jgi:hypothetical protein
VPFPLRCAGVTGHAFNRPTREEHLDNRTRCPAEEAPRAPGTMQQTLFDFGTLSSSDDDTAPLACGEQPQQRLEHFGEGAMTVACVHNHPSSGDPAPSAPDMAVTRQLREAFKAVDLELLDHVIIGRKECDPLGVGFFSFRSAGIL